MDLPEGFHREVIESIEGIDFGENSIKNTVAISPLNSGGSNFKTHVLTKKSHSKLAYKPSFGGALFSFFFNCWTFSNYNFCFKLFSIYHNLLIW